MTQYSGRTTQHTHKFDNWRDFPVTDKPAIKQVTLFDVQWSDCPAEIEDEVQELWTNYGLGNDNYIVKWNSDMSHDYPLIGEYLKAHNITECLIHWWW